MNSTLGSGIRHEREEFDAFTPGGATPGVKGSTPPMMTTSLTLVSE